MQQQKNHFSKHTLVHSHVVPFSQHFCHQDQWPPSNQLLPHSNSEPAFVQSGAEAGTKLERKSKYLPREARSGYSLTVETFPECNALPCRSTQSARVCCSLPVCINASKELKNVFLENSLYI